MKYNIRLPICSIMKYFTHAIYDYQNNLDLNSPSSNFHFVTCSTSTMALIAALESLYRLICNH